MYLRKTENVQIPFKGVAVQKSVQNFFTIGKMRHLGSMPEDSGSRYKRPAFSLKLEKPENLSFLAQILFESSQTPRINRVKYGFHVVFLFHSFLVLTVEHRLCRGHQAKRTFGQQMKGPL